MDLTSEQAEICEDPLNRGGLVVVNAYAGSGKSTTLRLLAEMHPRHKFLYLCFNKTVAEAARRVFPSNVRVSTMHGIAYAGAQLRAGQVDYDPAWSPQRPLGLPQVLDHAQPRRGVIMGAIDAHAVHALLEQVLHEKIVFRSLARHGDHNPNSTPFGRGSKQGFSMFGEQLLPLGKINNLYLLRARLPGRIRQSAQHSQNRVDRG